jgi:PHP family Zn ribbon phosphoesterase
MTELWDGQTLDIACPNCRTRVNIVNICFEENWRCINCMGLFKRKDVLEYALKKNLKKPNPINTPIKKGEMMGLGGDY